MAEKKAKWDPNQRPSLFGTPSATATQALDAATGLYGAASSGARAIGEGLAAGGRAVGGYLGITPDEAAGMGVSVARAQNATAPFVVSAARGVVGAADGVLGEDPPPAAPATSGATSGAAPPFLPVPEGGSRGSGYVTVGTGKYVPHSRVTKGIELEERQIGTEVKPVAVNPRDVKDDEIVIDYRWQTTGANFPPANEINPTGRPAAEVLSEMSSENGYIDPNGFVWKLTSDKDGKPQYMKGAPVVNREVPIMGTAKDVAIMAGESGVSASEESINAQRDLELAKIQANQNQVDKRRAVEDEILKREEKRNTNLTIANAHFSQLVSDLEDEKVNPSRQFQKLTPAGRMARVVYLFTAGMRGPEFLKLAMDQLNTDVERDIDAQKQAINAKKDRANGQLQIIKNMRDQFDTERDADNAYFAVRLRQLGDDMETEIAGIKNAAIRAKAEETLATIRTAQADKALAIEADLAPETTETEVFDAKRKMPTGRARGSAPKGMVPVRVNGRVVGYAPEARAGKVQDRVSAAEKYERRLADLEAEMASPKWQRLPFSERNARITSVRADAANAYRTANDMGTLDAGAQKLIDTAITTATERTVTALAKIAAQRKANREVVDAAISNDLYDEYGDPIQSTPQVDFK
jgi:hypothetical protein